MKLAGFLLDRQVSHSAALTSTCKVPKQTQPETKQHSLNFQWHTDVDRNSTYMPDGRVMPFS